LLEHLGPKNPHLMTDEFPAGIRKIAVAEKVQENTQMIKPHPEGIRARQRATPNTVEGIFLVAQARGIAGIVPPHQSERTCTVTATSFRVPAYSNPFGARRVRTESVAGGGGVGQIGPVVAEGKRLTYKTGLRHSRGLTANYSKKGPQLASWTNKAVKKPHYGFRSWISWGVSGTRILAGFHGAILW
jgi:hypothetical protein